MEVIIPIILAVILYSLFGNLKRRSEEQNRGNSSGATGGTGGFLGTLISQINEQMQEASPVFAEQRARAREPEELYGDLYGEVQRDYGELKKSAVPEKIEVVSKEEGSREEPAFAGAPPSRPRQYKTFPPRKGSVSGSFQEILSNENRLVAAFIFHEIMERPRPFRK